MQSYIYRGVVGVGTGGEVRTPASKMERTTTTYDRTLTADDYLRLCEHYARLTLTTANNGLKANRPPRPEELADAAREKLAADDVLADTDTLALVLREGDATADYHGQDARASALASLTADVAAVAAGAEA